MKSHNNMSGWSDLPTDLLFLIVTSQKQLSFVDIESMAQVCKLWRCTLRKNNWFGLGMNNKESFPWLMLSEMQSEIGSGKRGFFNPITGHVAQVYLPEAAGRRCCGSSYGWIVTMGEDMDIKLLNPLTRDQLTLPSQLTFDRFSDGTTNEELHRSCNRKELVATFIRKAALTCSPKASDECLVVAFVCPREDFEFAFTKLGDATWTLIPAKTSAQQAIDFLFCRGQLFGTNLIGELMVLDLSHAPHPKWKIISTPLYHLCRHLYSQSFGSFYFYLVEIADEILTIVRVRTNHKKNFHKTVKAGVFKYQKEKWCQIKEVGNCCFFLGSNTSISLSPVPRGYIPNSIYFTDDFPILRSCQSPPKNVCLPITLRIRGTDMVIYSIVNDKMSPFFHGESLSEYSPPLWLTLNF